VSAAVRVDCCSLTADDDVYADESERITWVKSAPSLNEYLHTGSSMYLGNA